MSPPPRRVAIIGAGLAGLTLAYRLTRLPQPPAVTLFESADRPGGVIGTDTVDVPGAGRFVLDRGADMFAVNPPGALTLCRDLGMEDRLLRPKAVGRGAMIVRRGRLHRIPEGFVLMRATRTWPMLTTPLLSPAAKLRLLAERFVSSRGADIDDESVGDFVRRRYGLQVAQRIVTPLVAGIYTGDIDKISMAAAMGPIWQMESEHRSLARATAARRRSGGDATERGSAGARYEAFRAPAGGMGELIDTLAASLPPGTLRPATAVEKLRRDGEQFVVDAQQFDHVILATAARPAAALLQTIGDPAADDAAEALAAIESASTAIIVVGFRRSAAPGLPATFGIVVPPAEGRRILAISFASEKFSGRAPDGFVIARVFIGGRLDPAAMELDDDQLADLATEQLGELIGLQNAPGDVVLRRVVRWTEAMPQYDVGHLQRVAKIESAIDRLPGVDLLCNALRGVGIAPVVGSADRLVAKVG